MEFLRRQRSVKGAAALLAVALLLVGPARAQPSLELYEQKIKAGLVYNFLKYTTWPHGILPQDGRLGVCMFGDGPFSDYLYPLRGRTAQQHAIEIRRIHSAGDTDGCHLMFVHRNMESSLPALLAGLKDKPVLTVSDIDRFTEKGGMVELTLLNQRVSLRINAKAVETGGIAIQPRLMKLSSSAG